MFVSLYFVSFFFLLVFSLVSFFLGLYVLGVDYCMLMDWEILSVNTCSFSMTLIFDWMSLVFVGCVLFISSMVVFYSYSYMYDDYNKDRFWC